MFIGSYIIWARDTQKGALKLAIKTRKLNLKAGRGSFNRKAGRHLGRVPTQLKAYFTQDTTLDCRMTLEFLLLSVRRRSPQPFPAATKYANKLLITSECNPCTEVAGAGGAGTDGGWRTAKAERGLFLIHNSNFTPQ